MVVSVMGHFILELQIWKSVSCEFVDGAEGIPMDETALTCFGFGWITLKFGAKIQDPQTIISNDSLCPQIWNNLAEVGSMISLLSKISAFP